MAFTFKEYAERLNKSVVACEKLIDHRIRLAVTGHKFDGIVTIYGSDITEEMIDILAPRYMKAGWIRISKPSADKVAFYYNKTDITFTPPKELKKRKDAVIATKARPIKVGLTREVDDCILNYADDEATF